MAVPDAVPAAAKTLYRAAENVPSVTTIKSAQIAPYIKPVTFAKTAIFARIVAPAKHAPVASCVRETIVVLAAIAAVVVNVSPANVAALGAASKIIAANATAAWRAAIANRTALRASTVKATLTPSTGPKIILTAPEWQARK